jgi:hypothetical protein
MIIVYDHFVVVYISQKRVNRLESGVLGRDFLPMRVRNITTWLKIVMSMGRRSGSRVPVAFSLITRTFEGNRFLEHYV